MAAKHITVFGMYPHRASFEYALSALQVAGFSDTGISALIHSNPESKDPFMISGPFAATLAGIGTGGKVSGIAEALLKLGIPEYEAKKYRVRIRNGGVLLSVHCDDDPDCADKAKDVLNSTGAENVFVQ